MIAETTRAGPQEAAEKYAFLSLLWDLLIFSSNKHCIHFFNFEMTDSQKSCTYGTKNFYFQNDLKWVADPTPNNLQILHCVFPAHKGILRRYYHLILRPHSCFDSCLPNVFYSKKKKSLESHIAFSCHVCSFLDSETVLWSFPWLWQL